VGHDQELDRAATGWEEYIKTIEQDGRLSELKCCIDDINCIEREKVKSEEYVNELIRESYAQISLVDVKKALDRDSTEQDQEKDTWISVMRTAIKAKGERRAKAKRQRPLSEAWNKWREGQKKRYEAEDKSIRGREISFIPFAIELTVGCSGGCSFCGFSAGKLYQQERTYQQEERVYTEILKHIKALTGQDYGQYGILYWATDPMDQGEYEKYAMKFKDIMGTLPCTTTALAEQNIVKLKQLIRLYKASKTEDYWKLRVSIRNEKAYRLLKSNLSKSEQAIIEINPQYGWLENTFAKAGRAYKGQTIEEQQLCGGTIACITGFEISLPLRRIRLITPCLADEVNKNGYRIIHEESFSSSLEFKEKLNSMLAAIDKPNLKLGDYIKPNIAETHHQLYCNKATRSILESLRPKGIGMRDLLIKNKDIPTVDIARELALLMQDGSIYIASNLANQVDKA